MNKQKLFRAMFFVIFFIFGVALIFWLKWPSHQIGGVVAKVEYNVEGTSFISPDIEKTTIRFEDGRVKVFNNIKGIIQEGKFNTISYNIEDKIVCVKIR